MNGCINQYMQRLFAGAFFCCLAFGQPLVQAAQSQRNPGANLGENVGAQIDSFVDSIITKLQARGPGLAQALAQPLKTALTQIFSDPEIKNGFQSMLNSAGDGAAGLSEALAKGLFTGIQKSFEGSDKSVEQTVKKMAGAVFKGLGQAVEDSSADLEDSKVIENIINAMDKNMGKIGDKFGENLENLGDSAGQAGGNVLRGISKGVTSLAWSIGQPALLVTGGFTILGITGYATYRALDYLKEYFIKKLHQPSWLSIIEAEDITVSLKDLHYAPGTQQQMEDIINEAKAVVNTDGKASFRNVMLWGDPGTGKTAFLQVLCKEANMTLIKTSGGDFAKLRGKDIELIDNAFRRARNNNRPVVFFVDEAERIFASRANKETSEDMANLLTKMLADFPINDTKIMMVCATNRPEDMDEAIFRRLPRQIYVGLPDAAGRLAILKIYRNKLFTHDTEHYSKKDCALISSILTDSVLDSVANRVGAIAPAELENMMIDLKNKAVTYAKGIPSVDMLNTVVDENLAIMRARKGGFERLSALKAQQEKAQEKSPNSRGHQPAMATA